MSESNHRPRPDPLDAAAAALRAAPVPPGPPPELAAATLAAVLPPTPPAEPAHGRRAFLRRSLMRYSFAGVAAAALVAAAVFWPSAAPAAAAVADALANADKAESFKLRVRTGEGKAAAEVVFHAAKGRSRMEVVGQVVVITDDTAKKELTLDVPAKTATLAAVADDDAAVGPGLPAGAADFLSEFTGKLSDLKGDGVKRTGAVADAGRKLDVYEVTVPLAGKPTVWVVWIDPAAKLPVRLASAAGQAKPLAVTIEYSDWGAAFDPALFRLDVPAGYTLVAEPKKGK